MIDKILDYMLRLAFTSIFVAAAVAVWLLVWSLFEGTKIGNVFIEWLNEKRKKNDTERSD